MSQPQFLLYSRLFFYLYELVSQTTQKILFGRGVPNYILMQLVLRYVCA